MRKQKNIIINDDGHELTFKITQLSALQLEIFLLKATKVLAKAGILNSEVKNDSADNLNLIADSLLNNLPSVLGALDVDESVSLISDLLARCVVKTDGKLTRVMTSEEVDAVFSTVPALFELQKETVKFNLDFLLAGKNSSESTSNQMAGATSSQKIFLRSHK